MAWRCGHLRFGGLAKYAAAVVLSAAVLMTAAGPADARGRHHRHYAHSARHHVHYVHRGYAGHRAQRAFAAIPRGPAFSAIVVDANSGRTLYSVAEDGLRHPASVTKVMTLYLLFEQLDKGAMTLDTRIPVSERAAAQEPSKLGVPAGRSIAVEDAIKAIVTRSANDIAVAVAEAIGGDEATFAGMMTRKARVLGMQNTLYRNASGLPNEEQVTTAHDLAILGRSIQERFPRYFRYFATHDFVYAGRTIGNHNHLLGRVDGVDGIKTGYTRASGFNLLTSVHRGGRSIVAVVMGGTSAPARDRIMENLIEDHIAEGSTVRTATMIAEATDDDAPKAVAAAAPAPAAPAPVPVAVKVPSAKARAAAVIAEGDDSEADDADAGTFQVAAVKPVAKARLALAPAVRKAALVEPSAADRGWKKGPDAAGAVDPRPVAAFATRDAPARQGPARQGWVKGPDAARAPAETTIARPAPARREDSDDDADDAPAAARGWIIQLGATDDAAAASALLARARAHSRALLADAKPVTEKVRKGGDTLYRARFAGLEQTSARSACRTLKRSGFECFATRD